ncbi:Na+/H+ antiporter NhaC [Phocicoccus pinnipedialis]|uniref:Malate-2H(+)/Na(+)-lactate antiporter n=1 Tax=Phocicoccus pinnipedialis TaxID=110845 RepID=A0A6V7R5Q6_9BACL|nr:Na+/H+ antiporter NhaC [Jeotgalicoccus pinnipedialis]MBP1939785.1 NhaC family Na+:H+ antiporter [Jeotgalicoccus pinnipedialis]CAD2072413.1 Malate-2H(+)/Na(+)-lactate antiporter [Jeotgalicoccus pinnipedialis]
MNKELSRFEAFLPIIFMMLLLGIGYGIFSLNPEPLLILAALFTGLIGIKNGYTWSDMESAIQDKFRMALPAILILVSIGLLIALWMAAGIIPMFIYYGIQLISPKFIIAISFIIAALISTVTGTSWGSVGTVGVALMAIASTLDANLAATAGSIIAGAYFGDKLSPLSDTTNLAPIAAGSNLYEHIKHMFWTTIPAAILSLIVYLIVGMNAKSNVYVSNEKIDVMLTYLSEHFSFNILLLIPPLLILFGALKKLPTLPIIIMSSITAAILAIIFQGAAVQDLFTIAVSGFEISYIDNVDTAPADIVRLLTQGGLASMTGVLLIAFCAFSFAGIMTAIGALDVIIETLLLIVKRVGDLILATVLSGIIMAIVTGSSYLSIIIPAEMYRKSYQKFNLKMKNLSRTTEDAGTVVVPIIPWSSAGVFMATTLGVSTIEYLPWAIVCYSGFIFAIIYGYTGIGIAYEDEKTAD